MAKGKKKGIYLIGPTGKKGEQLIATPTNDAASLIKRAVSKGVKGGKTSFGYTKTLKSRKSK